MTAVNPARLAHQVAELMGFIGDPGEFRRRCLDLLESYADRTRRPRGDEQQGATLRVFGAPRSVVHSLALALRAETAKAPDRGWAVANVLWQAGARETCLLAASVVGALPLQRAAEWAADKARTCEDALVLAELGGAALSAWRGSNPEEFLEVVDGWLSEGEPRVAELALAALAQGAHELKSDCLPNMFRMLLGRLGKTRGGAQRAIHDIVRTTARRSPAEAARYLIDEIAAGSMEARRLAHEMAGEFPDNQRHLLEDALSG